MHWPAMNEALAAGPRPSHAKRLTRSALAGRPNRDLGRDHVLDHVAHRLIDRDLVPACAPRAGASHDFAKLG
jgi:hypothetical protein